MRSIIFAVLLSLAAPVAAQDIKFNFKSAVCGAFQGSWEETDFKSPYPQQVTAQCVIRNNVGSACKIYGTNTSANPQREQRYGGNFIERDGKFLLEMRNLENPVMVVQMICKNNGRCDAFRLYNETNWFGIQCLSREALR